MTDNPTPRPLEEHVVGKAKISYESAEAIRRAAALASEPPVGTREPDAWLREYRTRDGEWVKNAVSQVEFPPPNHPQIRDVPLFRATPSAGAATGAEPHAYEAHGLRFCVRCGWDEDDAVHRAAAEQPRTVGERKDYTAGDAFMCGTHHIPLIAVNGYGWECPECEAPTAAPEGSPTPEPHTQERETLEVSIADLIIETLTEAHEGFLRPGMFSVRAARLARHIAALRTPAPSGEAEVREWWEMPGMLLKGETLEQNLRRSREAQGERTTTRNEGEGS